MDDSVCRCHVPCHASKAPPAEAYHYTVFPLQWDVECQAEMEWIKDCLEPHSQSELISEMQSVLVGLGANKNVRYVFFQKLLELFRCVVLGAC